MKLDRESSEVQRRANEKDLFTSMKRRQEYEAMLKLDKARHARVKTEVAADYLRAAVDRKQTYADQQTLEKAKDQEHRVQEFENFRRNEAAYVKKITDRVHMQERIQKAMVKGAQQNHAIRVNIRD
jgi:hypothetical protein